MYDVYDIPLNGYWIFFTADILYYIIYTRSRPYFLEHVRRFQTQQ